MHLSSTWRVSYLILLVSLPRTQISLTMKPDNAYLEPSSLAFPLFTSPMSGAILDTYDAIETIIIIQRPTRSQAEIAPLPVGPPDTNSIGPRFPGYEPLISQCRVIQGN